MDPKQQLDYLRQGAQQASRSRIIVHRDQNGITFTDPPFGKRPAAQSVLIALLVRILIALIIVWVFVKSLQLPLTTLLPCWLAIAAVNTWNLLRDRRNEATNPTIIELSSTLLTLTLPSRRQIVIPTNRVADIHATRPRSTIGFRRRSSSLFIRGAGRSWRLLPNRNYPEIKWLATLLRLELGMSRKHSAEPEDHTTADPLEPGELEAVLSDPTPLSRAIKRSDYTRKTFGQAISREYNNLGCASMIGLLVLVIGGIFLVTHFAELIVICLQFGSDAYFHHGLRPIPHRGFFKLNDGQEIASPYKLLFISLYFVLMTVWVTISLFVAIAMNRAFARMAAKKRRIVNG